MIELATNGSEDVEVKEEHTKADAKKSKRRARESPATTTGRRKGKGKPERDPNAPKKPLTAFMQYCNFRRGQMKESNSSKPHPRLHLEGPENGKLKVIGGEWAHMSEVDKEVMAPTTISRGSRRGRRRE